MSSKLKPKQEIKKKHFTEEEDMKLKALVEQYGEKDWQLISQYMPGRTSRQCRERYTSYLMPNLVVRPWTQEEDNLLILKLQEIGPKWTQMVPFFKGRSNSHIKNRWYKHLKKKASKSFIDRIFGKNTKLSSQLAIPQEMQNVTPQMFIPVQFGFQPYGLPYQPFNYVVYPQIPHEDAITIQQSSGYTSSPEDAENHIREIQTKSFNTFFTNEEEDNFQGFMFDQNEEVVF